MKFKNVSELHQSVRDAIDLARSFGDKFYTSRVCFGQVVDALYHAIDNIITIEFQNYTDFAGKDKEDVRHDVWCYLLEKSLLRVEWGRRYGEIATFLITTIRMLIKNEFRGAIKQKYAQEELKKNMIRGKQTHVSWGYDEVWDYVITEEFIQEAEVFMRRINLSRDDEVAFKLALYLVRNEVP